MDKKSGSVGFGKGQAGKNFLPDVTLIGKGFQVLAAKLIYSYNYQISSTKIYFYNWWCKRKCTLPRAFSKYCSGSSLAVDWWKCTKGEMKKYDLTSLTATWSFTAGHVFNFCIKIFKSKESLRVITNCKKGFQNWNETLNRLLNSS